LQRGRAFRKSARIELGGHLFENAEEDVSMFEKLERDLLAA